MIRNLSFIRIHLCAKIILVLHGTPLLAESAERQVQAAVPITAALCDDMKLHKVLNPGAPVGCDRLKLVKFGYIGFDGRLHGDGEIVVMDAVANHVLQIFDALRNRQFPIAKAQLLNKYDGDDEASMADNNTSAFNVREIAGGGSVSMHAFGLAIDVNPIQNPYIKRFGRTLSISPKSGFEFADRRTLRPGMTEAIVDVFADHGFLVWGGAWSNPTDYQHFQVSRSLVDQLIRASPDSAQTLFEYHVEQYRTCISAPDARKMPVRKSCTSPNAVAQ